MEYESKIIPEGINTSKEHPLREFIVLGVSISLVIVFIVGLLSFSADYLIGYIPVEKENEWFSAQTIEPFNIKNNENKTEEIDPAVTEIENYLQNLITQLRREDQQDFRFNVRLLDNDTPNAFVAPGGNIFVTRGLLESVSSENGLAMVLAHEMGHQYYRHPLRAAGRGIVITLALLIISGTDNSTLAQSFISNTALLTNLSFSRDQEREADNVGIERLNSLYGHSHGSSEFFETIHNNPELETDMPAFMSTHPGVEERIKTLRQQETGKSIALKPLPTFIGRYLENSKTKKE